MSDNVAWLYHSWSRQVLERRASGQASAGPAYEAIKEVGEEAFLQAAVDLATE